MSGATAAGTRAFAEAFARELPAAHFRALDGLSVSSIGLGTYLGDEDDAADRGYGEAIVYAANLGCNFFDTAINYRAQRSERVLGQALAALERDGSFRREQLDLCTKGGYLAFDGGVPPDPTQYVVDTYIRPGAMTPEDVVGGAHCMTPHYPENQIGRSPRNPGVPTIHVHHGHQPGAP